MTTETKEEYPAVERRRARLPQPDFSVYKNANAYPGNGYFFVGHSYNLDTESNPEQKTGRAEAIKKLFSTDVQWITAHDALKNAELSTFLTRFEHDLLTRLPDNALIGPAISSSGQLIGESFTIWRKEMRRSS